MKANNLSNEEFQLLAADTQALFTQDRSLDDFKNGVETLHAATGLENIAKVSTRTINGGTFRIGAIPRNKKEAAFLAKFYVEHAKNDKLEFLNEDLERRLKDCTSLRTRIDRLKFELQEMSETKEADDFYYAGYNAELSGKPISYFVAFNALSTPDNYNMCTFGTADYLFKDHVHSELEAAEEQLRMELEETEVNLLSSPRQILILLKGLGILQHLVENFESLKEKRKTDFAKLICLICGVKTARMSDFAKDIDAVLYGRPTSKKDKHVISDVALNNIHSKLSAIGFTSEQLDDFDKRVRNNKS